MKTQRSILVVCTSTMIVLVLDSSIVGVMLPSMRSDLDLSDAGIAWVVSSYLLALAVLLPVAGRVVDALGPVTAFTAGMTGFAVASAGIATSSGAGWLIAWRTGAGVAAAVLMPATMSLILNGFDDAERPRAFAIYAGVGQAFATVGPALGGVCAQYLSWRWAFLVNVPIGVGSVVLLAAARLGNPRSASARWDVLGLLLLVTGLTGVVLALAQLPTWGATPSLVLLVVGCVLLAVLVRHSLRVADPILDIALLRGRTFTGGVVILGCLGFGMTVAAVFGAVALQDSLQLLPTAGGIALLPLVVPLLLATRWVANRYRRVGARNLAVIGTTAMTIGLVVIAVGADLPSVWLVCVGLVPVGVGIGLLLSPLNTASLADVPNGRRGQASALVSAARQFGSVVGVAVFSVVTTTDAGAGFAMAAVVLAAGIVVALRVLPVEKPVVMAS